jgi:hypothetical protein
MGLTYAVEAQYDDNKHNTGQWYPEHKTTDKIEAEKLMRELAKKHDSTPWPDKIVVSKVRVRSFNDISGY